MATGILKVLADHSADARNVLLTCRPSTLPLLTAAVEHGTPAVVALSLGKCPPQWLEPSGQVCCMLLLYVKHSACPTGILKTLALSEDSRAKTLQDLRDWQWQGLAQAISYPVKYSCDYYSMMRSFKNKLK